MNSTVKMSPQQIALKELSDSGLVFVLIRQPLDWGKAGDIDILIKDFENADDLLKNLGYIRVADDEFSKKYIKYDCEFEQWIHIDAATIISFWKLETPRMFIESLFNKIYISDDGIPLLDSVDETILLILHSAIDKGCFNPNYIENILNCDINAMLDQTERYSFLPKPMCEHLRGIKALCEGKITEQQAINEIRRSFSSSRIKGGSLMGRICRRLKAFFWGPRAIVFIGPDGSGKSTLAQQIARLRWPSIRYQYMGPARESEMRFCYKKLLGFFSQVREKYSKKNIIGIMSRMGWQIICYLDFADRLCRHMYFWGSGGVVIFDRYACDMYFRKPNKWNELLFIRMFPRPRFAFLCTGDADAIYNRKKDELTPEEIQSTIELYRSKLISLGIPHKEVNTTEFCERDMLVQIVKYLRDNNWFYKKSS